MHVAITGASSGIGEAIARELAKIDGVKLTLVARREPLLRALAATLAVPTRIVAHDLSDSERATTWLDGAEAEHGPIDVLVNNAGVENHGRMIESSVDVATLLLHTNLHSPLRLARELAPRMIARKSGTIVNVSSIAALATPPAQAWYGASKAGLAAFSEGLRTELIGTGVRVITVYPGPVKTAMGDAGYAVYGGKKGAIGMLPEGTPTRLAELVRDAIDDGRARVFYPRFYAILRVAPWLASLLMDVGAPRLYRA